MATGDGLLAALRNRFGRLFAGRAATRSGISDEAAMAVGLAMEFLQAYQRSGRAPLLVKAIALFRGALRATPTNHTEHALISSALGDALHILFERNGNQAVLAESVEIGRRAVADLPVDHPYHAAALSNLAGSLWALYGQVGNEALLAEAVDAMRQGVAATPADDPNYGKLIGNLGSALRTLVEQKESDTVLAEMVEAGRRAVAATPTDDADYAMQLSNLGNALHLQYHRTGDLSALLETVELRRRVMEITSSDHPGHPMFSNNLSNALRNLFERTGEVPFLVEAVEAGRRAVAAAPVDYPALGGLLTNASIALAALSEQTGDVTVLEEAVEVGRRAAAVTPVGNLNHSLYLNNLSCTLRDLFERTGKMAALVEAAEAGRRAVAHTPTESASRPLYLNTFSIALRMVFERLGDAGNVSLLREAVEAGRRAVATTPTDHPDYAGFLNDLGLTLRALFKRTTEVAVLQEAVEAGRRAVALTSADQPAHAAYLMNLGSSLWKLSDQTGNAALSDEAVGCYRSAAQNTVAMAVIRAEAFRQVALGTDIESDDLDEALAAVESAVDLLPQISSRTLALSDREHQVGQLNPLAEVAAAVALAGGRLERAVELMEATRGILVAGSIDTRSGDLALLRERDPDLARRYQELLDRCAALARPTTDSALLSDTGPSNPAWALAGRHTALALAEARRKAQAEWDSLLGRIRSIDGFSGFPAGPSFAELADQAGQGAIVYLIAGSKRCDALILTGIPERPVRAVGLDQLTLEDASAQAIKLMTAHQVANDPDSPAAERKTAQQDILDVLGWLWDVAAEPVLKALGHTVGPAGDQPWPRLWWCPVGIMGHLPVHAAGHHRDLQASDPAVAATPRAVLDRVISSYTPTVRALAHARSRPPVTAEGTLIVAIPDAPGTRPLTGVGDEVDAITALIPDALRPDRPGREEVLAALPGHPVAHFSCHGLADWSDPAAGYLVLHDHLENPLTVADISALRLTGALAFLSACDTSSSSPRMADEAQHLTGAFHLAGYQNVVGTLWPVNDRAASRATTDFYAELTAGGTMPPDTTKSALALHHAVRGLRARYPITPTHWAAHTHTGT